jgi:DDE superfamily endonuclease
VLGWAGGQPMTERVPLSSGAGAPGSLRGPLARDPLFGTLAQRRGFREYLHGLLLPRDRTKTLTALAGAEPVVAAQAGAVQRLQFFVSESVWEAEAINTRRLFSSRSCTWWSSPWCHSMWSGGHRPWSRSGSSC